MFREFNKRLRHMQKKLEEYSERQESPSQGTNSKESVLTVLEKPGVSSEAKPIKEMYMPDTAVITQDSFKRELKETKIKLKEETNTK